MALHCDTASEQHRHCNIFLKKYMILAKLMNNINTALHAGIQ